MRLVLLITLLESLAVTFWLVRPWLSRHLLTATEESSLTRAGMPIVPSPNPRRVSLSNDRSHWAFVNSWQVASQADDRTPAVINSAPLGSGPSARRAFARQNQQVSYKEWSRGRHDF